MNKFLVMLFAFLIAVTFNDSFAARKKSSGKKAKATSSKSYKAKKKAKKTTKTTKKASQETEDVIDE